MKTQGLHCLLSKGKPRKKTGTSFFEKFSIDTALTTCILLDFFLTDKSRRGEVVHNVFQGVTGTASLIRIYRECEGRIEKSVPGIAVWHHEACQVMTNGDPEGRIFLSYPHTHDRFFFLLTTFLYIYLRNRSATAVNC